MSLINQIPIFIFLTLFSGLLGNKEIGKWWIGNHPHKTLVINEGDPIEISCLTEKPTIFYYPKHRTSDFTISHEKKEAGFTLHTFRRPKAIHGDTAFYCCLEVNSTTIDSNNFDRDFSTQKPLNLTYIYVKSKKYAFATGLSRNVYGWVQGMSMEIFCRPSSPDIHVELEHHYGGNRKVITSDKRVFWEPKNGFIVKNIQAIVDDGLYICKANHNGHTQERLYSISISNESSLTQQYINDDGEPIKQGKSITLNCTVLIMDVTKYELNWITPRKNDRVSTKIYSRRADMGEVVTNQLNIINFTKDDEGDYKCDFVNLDKSEPKIKSVKKSLQIYDPKSRYINIIYDRAEKNFIRYPGDDIYIIVRVDAFPRPNVQWLNPKGEEIHTSGKFFADNSDFYPRLIIENIELSDAGVYTLQVSHGDQIQTIKFTLDVKAF